MLQTAITKAEEVGDKAIGIAKKEAAQAVQALRDAIAIQEAKKEQGKVLLLTFVSVLASSKCLLSAAILVRMGSCPFGRPLRDFVACVRRWSPFP